jgi:GDP-D-mannose 3', 5'-epimerase
MQTKVLVTGAGGFIGHHLVKYLKAQGYWVRGVDIKAPEFETSAADDFQLLDLRVLENCRAAAEGIQEAYNLAADMGGIGYITGHHADITRNNTLINVFMLEAAREAKIERYLFSSSACVYPQFLQKDAAVTALQEDTAWPADPEAGYGLEKLYTEKLCEYYGNDFGMKTRIVRFHNVFGPLGTYDGGKEKAPAALARKIALTPDGGTIEVWGDGEQTRSFMFIDDCLKGLDMLMHSDFNQPLNLGRTELVSINKMIDMIAGIAGKTIHKKHDTTKPQGVRGRNSDNDRIKEVLGWEPGISLEAGLIKTYPWIKEELVKRGDPVF